MGESRNCDHPARNRKAPLRLLLGSDSHNKATRKIAITVADTFPPQKQWLGKRLLARNVARASPYRIHDKTTSQSPLWDDLEIECSRVEFRALWI